MQEYGQRATSGSSAPLGATLVEDGVIKRPFVQTVIYEMHVRGFTQHPSSGVPPEQRGTFAGVIAKIPYLQGLGVTAVELLPVFQFDPLDAPAGRVNYWGYQPVSFFAPHHAFSSRPTPLGVLDEFRDMVKALHRAGIEVILDVVFNHSAEGGSDGPTICYKGLANDVYYILQEDRSRYADYTGCSNTLNANQPIVRRMIQDSLRYWVTEMHVDGFRFDLASILSRDERGNPMPNPPVLWDIDSDPVLAGTKLIAEAWDAAGLYQVGSFVGDFWQEWNGRFRDDVRRFVRGDVRTRAEISWHGVVLDQPDWGDSSRSLALTIRPLHGQSVLHAMFNAYWEPLTFALPPRGGAEPWRRWLDTALPSPDDIGPITLAPMVETSTYTVHARSVVVLAVGVKGPAHE